MYLKIHTFMPDGYSITKEIIEISIQRRGIPSFDILGVPHKIEREQKHRIKSAIIASGYTFPRAKISVTFSRFSGQLSYKYTDLQIALGIILGQSLPNLSGHVCLFGELCLDGTVKDSFLGELFQEAAYSLGACSVISNSHKVIKTDNNSINMYKVHTLTEAVMFCENKCGLPKISYRALSFEKTMPEMAYFGNLQAKRCLEIAVAGKHNLLLVGPPGVGKTSLISFIPYLHYLDEQAAIQINRQNMLNNIVEQAVAVPILKPILNSSLYKIVNQSSAASHNNSFLLAHNGYVFIDEFLEQPIAYLESLKKVMDDKAIGSQVCDFTLIAACNPCKCGNYGSSAAMCTCSLQAVARYRNKLSGGLLNRFDLMAYVDIMDSNLPISKDNSDNWFEGARQRIEAACVFNNRSTDIMPNVETLLKKAINNYSLSARSINKLLQVSRTIANLEQSPKIKPNHVLEALSFRPNFALT